jgi:hypothetical protein
MRVICCLLLLLPGCATHAVRCEGRLQPINVGAPAGRADPKSGGAVPPSRRSAP